MRPKWRRVLAVLLLAAALGWSFRPRPAGGTRAEGAMTVTSVAADVLRIGELTLAPCTIGKPGQGAPTLRAYCTGFDVPEDHTQPGGRHIRLRVAVVRAEAAKPEADPVVFLDGGPGGAASEDYPVIAGAFADLRRRHWVLLVDQRGTGGSNPLSCDDDEEHSPPPPSRAPERVRECAARLAARAAPQYYATSDAVADLEALRLAMGGPQFDLLGVSYGTRVAQQYAKRYPKAVRAIVLDSAVPNDLALGSEHARNLEDALTELFARCRAQRSCTERFGDPYQTLQRVQARLRAQPQRLDMRDPYTFRMQQKTIDADKLGQLLRFYAYSPYTAALLPYVLAEADAGRYAPLLGQTQVVIGDVADHMSGGMALSVTCTEDVARLHPNPGDAGTVMGNALVEWLLSVCPSWPHAARPEDFAAPLTGPVPVLVLAGEHDPVTPPRYAAAIVRGLPNGRVLNVAGQGHGLVSVGCMPRLLGEFIRTLDARHLDAHCLEVLGQTPAFIDANGENP
ncbi:MAG TPA: alpha/beta hydrolase [Steroidobacteraceae bacterium]|nr:alpha/beta hydrolase [Steroidobacteraceae bacterium]